MLCLTFAQLRRSIGRLLSAGLAIVIGTAFVAATLVASDILDDASVAALNARFGEADLVVDGDALGPDTVAVVSEVPGVVAVHGTAQIFGQFEGAGTRLFLPVVPAASDPSLDGVDLVDGAIPGAGEIALPVEVAERLGVGIGDDLPLRRTTWQPPSEDAPDGAFEEITDQVRVAGLVRDPAGVFSGTGGIALGDAEEVASWVRADEPDAADIRHDEILLRVESDVSIAEVAASVAAVDDDLVVRTREEYAAVQAEELTGEADVLGLVGLAFGAVALIVAGLVIANTFSVLVAQRTRTLALLRCVGANARQLRRSVGVEALTLGLLASLLGIAAGLGLSQLVLSILRSTAGGASLPTTITPSVLVLVVPLVAGLVVTWIAALVPARAASRVAPLAAMRPDPSPDDARRGGRRRRVLSLVMVVVGSGLLLAGMVAGSSGEVAIGLLVGVVGGLVSFVGVLVSAVFWVPRVIGAVASLLARQGSATAALAAANSVRNPRRTAATSSALLIGVTLVAMMSSGAAVARSAFDDEFDRSFPVDVEVASATGAVGEDVVPADRLGELRAIDGVSEAIGTGSGRFLLDVSGSEVVLDAMVLDPAEAASVVRDASQFSELRDGAVLVPRNLVDALGFGDGVAATATPIDGQDRAIGDGGEVQIVAEDLIGGQVYLTPSTAERLDAEVTLGGAWLRLEDGAAASSVAASVQDAVADDRAQVTAAAAERDTYDQIVTTLLQIVVGLLGVAVVIALVGVANTLSLSVIERRRESATLRAIGLTRRQLRHTLAIEAMLIAGAGAVIGSVLGVVYGYLGSRTVLGGMADGVPLAVPWMQLGLLVAVALVAGVTASVLPGRRAARTPPVAALATE